MKIAIAGTGYVGLSNAILLAQHHEVYAVDLIEEKVNMINQGKSPLVDKEIEDYLANAKLNLTATTNGEMAYKDADYVIISTPTNYDTKTNYFDTSSVEDIIKKCMEVNPNTTMVVKSTIPVGFINNMKKKYNVVLKLWTGNWYFDGKLEYGNEVIVRTNNLDYINKIQKENFSEIVEH